MRTITIALTTALSLASTVLLADEPVSFKGKTVTLIVGSPAGGGTDGSARLIALLLADRLAGKPTLIVRNIPGAEGITAMNYFVRQVAPDGLGDWFPRLEREMGARLPRHQGPDARAGARRDRHDDDRKSVRDSGFSGEREIQDRRAVRHSAKWRGHSPPGIRRRAGLRHPD